jgi:predicted  nucleic acid-binding Zn-ribbon protein
MGSSNSKKLSPEEMKYLTPTGLYPSCSWDLKTIRKLIMEKKLAPFYPGREEKDAPDLDECPICFMFYGGGLNRTNCCHKDVCTECFLQIKKPGTPLLNSICPFCNRARFTVVFLGPKTREERLKEEMEEQKVIELQERMRQEEIERDIERQRQRQMEKDKRKEDDNEGEERIWSIAQNEGPPSSSKHDARSSTASAQDLAAPPFLPPSPTDASPEQDLEDLMVMEAIRLSLIDNGCAPNVPFPIRS